jgi:hypothetical protein
VAQLHACIECDLLHGKAFDQLLRERAAAQTKSLSGPHDDAARMRESTEQQRTLQKSCANLLVTSTMFLGESRSQSVEKIIVLVESVVEIWVRSSNQRLRRMVISITK